MNPSAYILERRMQHRRETLAARPAKEHRSTWDRTEVLSLLNALLEAERAGAKMTSVFMRNCEAGTVIWRRLNTLQREEAMNCAVLIGLIRRFGATPSTATAAFLRKALVVQGADARLAFLNRAQTWAVELIRSALPCIDDPLVKPALKRILLCHIVNIDRCERLIGK
jgi:hypothetical protein